MYKETVWEKIGNLLALPGKRFLLGLLSCLFLGPFGVFIAISIFESEKTYFVGNVTVYTDAGETVPCAIVKQNRYAFMPVVPFVSLFFYIPYKTNYFLLKDVTGTGLKKGARINSALLASGLVRMEHLVKTKAIAVEKNPQLLAQELAGQASQAREEFLQATKPFFDTGLMTETAGMRDASLCMLEDHHVLFCYAKADDGCRGMFINSEWAEKIKQDPSLLPELYLRLNPNNLLNAMVLLDDQTLERLLRARKTEAPAESQTETEVTPPAVEREQQAQVLYHIEQKKTLLTKAVIESALRKSGTSGKNWGGGLLCFLALGAIELGAVGLFTGVIPIALIFLPLGIWLSYVGIKQLRRAHKNTQHINNKQYRIVKSTCVSTTENVKETEDGTVVTYTAVFSNNARHQTSAPMYVAGDAAYLVYLEGTEKPLAVFRGVDYTPALDLVVET